MSLTTFHSLGFGARVQANDGRFRHLKAVLIAVLIDVFDLDPAGLLYRDDVLELSLNIEFCWFGLC